MDQRSEKTCGKCHQAKASTEFHVNQARRDGLNNICKPCARAKARAWREANHDRAIANGRRYYAENKEEYLRKCRIYREQNKDEIAARVKARYEANPELVEIQRARVRAWIRANPVKMAEHYHRKRARRKQRLVGDVDLAVLWTGVCGICGGDLDDTRKFPDSLSKSVDHVIPLALGGTHTQDNVQWAHLGCNTAKGARLQT